MKEVVELYQLREASRDFPLVEVLVALDRRRQYIKVPSCYAKRGYCIQLQPLPAWNWKKEYWEVIDGPTRNQSGEDEP